MVCQRSPCTFGYRTGRVVVGGLCRGRQPDCAIPATRARLPGDASLRDRLPTQSGRTTPSRCAIGRGRCKRLAVWRAKVGDGSWLLQEATPATPISGRRVPSSKFAERRKHSRHKRKPRPCAAVMQRWIKWRRSGGNPAGQAGGKAGRAGRPSPEAGAAKAAVVAERPRKTRPQKRRVLLRTSVAARFRRSADMGPTDGRLH